MPDSDDFRIDHTGIGVADIFRSVTFYDAALGSVGAACGHADHEEC